MEQDNKQQQEDSVVDLIIMTGIAILFIACFFKTII